MRGNDLIGINIVAQTYALPVMIFSIGLEILGKPSRSTDSCSRFRNCSAYHSWLQAAFFGAPQQMNVLVAGGAGYIGSHTVKRLKEAGHKPVIYDNGERGHRDRRRDPQSPRGLRPTSTTGRRSPRPCASTRSTRSCTSPRTPTSARASRSR